MNNDSAVDAHDCQNENDSHKSNSKRKNKRRVATMASTATVAGKAGDLSSKNCATENAASHADADANWKKN